jgi:hypothetical protein
LRSWLAGKRIQRESACPGIPVLFKATDAFVLFQEHGHDDALIWQFMCDKRAGCEVNLRCAPEFIEENLIFFS